MVVINKILENFLADKSDLKDIQKYIHKKWKKKHILSQNTKLFKWQHQFLKNKIDFIVKKKNKKIVSILGIINQSRDDKYSEISLAIWHSSKQSYGLSLMLNLLSKKNFKIVKATTISRKVIQLYKFLGFKVKNFNQYYLTNIDKKNQKITKNLIPNISNFEYQKSDIIFDKIENLFLYKKNVKNNNYIKWRFCNNPVFKYNFLTDKKLSLILICRVVKVKNLKYLNIVDFIGSFENKKKFTQKILFFLKLYNFHHLEFLHYGHEDLNILNSGYQKKKQDQILTLFTQPYLGLQKREIICGYKVSNFFKKIKIVRADGDADRPS